MDKIYRVTRWNSGSEYEHLGIEVYLRSEGLDKPVSVTWQTDRTCSSWYGGVVKFEANTADELARNLPILRAILGYECLYGSPQGVINLLRRKGYAHAIYDSRVSGFVPIGEVLPSDVQSWRDGHSGNCTVACLAKDEREAKRLIASEFVKYPEQMQEWVSAGMPVRLAYGQDAPNVRSIDELLRLDTLVPA